MNKLALVMVVLLMVLSIVGCASQPAFCPELTLKFCPTN